MERKNIEIGFVLGTKDSSPFSFFVAIKEDSYLQLDDLILMEESLLGEKISFYGVVSDVRKNFEGLNFNSENFLAVSGKIPTKISHVAEISVLRVDPEKYIAPTPGNPVYKVENPESVKLGYYFDKMDVKIPMGFFKNRLPAYLNYDFINGKKGAHVAISGISGVATKTSFATFLLYSVFQNAGVDKKNCKSVIFNVKGEDLLFLDKENRNSKEEHLSQYKELGLNGKPLESVSFYTSGKILPDKSLMSSAKTRDGLGIFAWSVKQIVENDLFSFFFSEKDDSNIGFIVKQAENALKEGFKKGGFPVDSMDSMTAVLRHFEQIDNQGALGKQHQSSIDAFLRRLARIAAHTKDLITPRASIENKINWNNSQVTVVDIHNLNSTAQMFVVSSVIKDIFDAKEEGGSREPLVFIMIDELNKYAPRSGGSPIKDILVDIAERGRSLGIVLVGACQTASEVEKRVYANSAIKVVGRLDAGEAESSEYKHLTPLMKKRAIILPQGEMIVYQPDVPYPLVINFPFPAWATRKDEEKQQSLENKGKKAKELMKDLI